MLKRQRLRGRGTTRPSRPLRPARAELHSPDAELRRSTHSAGKPEGIRRHTYPKRETGRCLRTRAEAAWTCRSFAARRRDGERVPRTVLAMEHMEPVEAPGTGNRFRDRGVEDFREVAAARGLALRWCPPMPSAASKRECQPEKLVESRTAAETGSQEGSQAVAGSQLEFTWPLEAFADAHPFVVELVLAEAPCT